MTASEPPDVKICSHCDREFGKRANWWRAKYCSPDMEARPMSIEEVTALLEGTTPGPWNTCYYDAGDRDEWANCPSVQAAPEYDCAVVHWDGFKQKYWQSARGQNEIDANARLIAAAPRLAREHIALTEQLAEMMRERDEWRNAACQTAEVGVRIAALPVTDEMTLAGWAAYEPEDFNPAEIYRAMLASRIDEMKDPRP